MKSTSFDTYRNLYQERWGYEVEGAGFQAGGEGEDFSPKSFSFSPKKRSPFWLKNWEILA